MKSYVERASTASISANSMERWYFVPNYECVQVSEDGLAMRWSETGQIDRRERAVSMMDNELPQHG